MFVSTKEGICPVAQCHDMQTEELLIKRRTLLEKKIVQELDKAKTYSKAQNKRGDRLPTKAAASTLALLSFLADKHILYAWTVYREPCNTGVCLDARCLAAHMHSFSPHEAANHDVRHSWLCISMCLRLNLCACSGTDGAQEEEDV